jgi:hypothetical protein
MGCTPVHTQLLLSNAVNRVLNRLFPHRRGVSALQLQYLSILSRRGRPRYLIDRDGLATLLYFKLKLGRTWRAVLQLGISCFRGVPEPRVAKSEYLRIGLRDIPPQEVDFLKSEEEVFADRQLRLHRNPFVEQTRAASPVIAPSPMALTYRFRSPQ